MTCQLLIIVSQGPLPELQKYHTTTRTESLRGKYNRRHVTASRIYTDYVQNNTIDIANHSAGFTWRFNDDDEPQESSTDGEPKQLIAGVKEEKAAFRAFKMCYVNANRKGDDGLTIAIGFHEQWLEEQRRQGSSVELIDVYCNALEFCAKNSAELHKLSLGDLQDAIMI
jgi:hypothetical protein